MSGQFSAGKISSNLMKQVGVTNTFALKTEIPKMQVGPRLSFSTAWAANAQSICQSCGLDKVTRIETSRRYLLRSSSKLSSADVTAFSAMVGLRSLCTRFVTNLICEKEVSLQNESCRPEIPRKTVDPSGDEIKERWRQLKSDHRPAKLALFSSAEPSGALLKRFALRDSN